MTTLREAAQQALRVACMCTPEQQIAKEALRAALAQQTQTPCDIAEDGVCEAIDCCRNRSQILEALEIGYDSAQAEAAQYHAAMAGYRPERHAEMDADVAKIAAAITAVKAALAQEEQAEPVAYTGDVARRMREAEMTFHLGMPHAVVMQQMTRFHDLVCAEASLRAAAAFAIPPRREWQSLTEEDMEELLPLYSDPGADAEMLEFARAIEVKLKEKNHG
jgi:hypothetical protein